MKRKFAILTIVAAVAVCGVAFTNLYVLKKGSENIKRIDKITESYDCIIVLGAGVVSERPSLMLEDRLITGIELYERGFSGKLIMSGDHGSKDYDEVNTMKSYALEAGVLSEDIFMDHAGFSTYETMYRAKEIFKVKKALIVTQSFHLNRAVYIANAIGIEADGVSSDRRTYRFVKKNEIREIFARSKDWLWVQLGMKPTYLGETIPVSGNGDLTND